MRRTGRRLRLATAVAALMLVLSASGAFATSGSGASSTLVARATFSDDIKVQQNHPADVLVVENTFLPGGYSGWHAHPGTTIILVKSGSIAIYTLQANGSCSRNEYSAGQGFVEEAGVYQTGINEGSVTADLFVTFTNVPTGGSNRIDLDPAPTGPGCPAK